jgi:glycerophosphoryl diester phosphodiesterase
MKFIAHRCNSLAKLNGALKAKAGWIEVDVSLSRGQLVLFHDVGASLRTNRKANSPVALDRALAWLAQRLKTYPTLQLVLDLKCMAIHQNLYRKSLMPILEAHSFLKENLILTSFHHNLLLALHEELPSWTYGAIVEASLVNLTSYLCRNLGFCTYVMLSHHIYDKKTLDELNPHFATGVYTVNNAAMWPVIEGLGVGFIFRDF